MAEPQDGGPQNDGPQNDGPQSDRPPDGVPVERRTSPRADRLTAPLVTAAVGLGCAAVAGDRLGRPGVLSAVLGAALVLGFFWSGLVPFLLARGQEGGKGVALLVLVLNYVTRLVALFAVLVVATQAGAVDRRAVGLSVVACSLAWTAAHVARLGRVSST